MEKVLEIELKSLGPSHVSVAMTRENIGYVYQKLGNLAQARSCIEEAHTIFVQSLGPDHPNTKKAARSLEQLQPRWEPDGMGGGPMAWVLEQWNRLADALGSGIGGVDPAGLCGGSGHSRSCPPAE
eukprot:CAMPEP_0172173864 /NCGR_PEP_ID=MMETSP1050-20130122/13328_1 /TAXON_ID=233186 /ORGANISM="Cryptomonas curvata, Strain CCAP979/52" /LENGTH=125 /DNA_ID=CAMNT_0012845741 /DNA_START=15 /DNA_END=392 /DNA_ORIENTATION=+